MKIRFISQEILGIYLVFQVVFEKSCTKYKIKVVGEKSPFSFGPGAAISLQAFYDRMVLKRLNPGYSILCDIIRSCIHLDMVCFSPVRFG